ncbi:MAG: mechanosensitive ion channel family protein [Pseudomonadota bacterium]
MEWTDLLRFLPAALAVAATVLVLGLTNYFLRRDKHGELSVSNQLLMLALTAAGILIVIFSLPVSETSRGQILSLLGIVVTAVIALSSTTFVANVMAGLMLRAVNSFRPGDFVRVQDLFGRVTERGIFHTEIQTEDRDLATLPNLLLVTNPVTVVHDSGTIISARLSLGYDVSHVRVEELLKQAADNSGLADSFVLVGELGDFSVSYRVGGFSADVSRLLTAKSNLRKNILLVMHEAGIEIVSPNFMNQRVLAEGKLMIPRRYRENTSEPAEASPEDVIFDKADTAAEREMKKQELGLARQRVEEIDAAIKSDPDSGPALTAEKEMLLRTIEAIEAELAQESK